MKDNVLEQAYVAEQIYTGKSDFDDVVTGIMRGEVKIHNLELSDCVNDALGDDEVSFYALEHIMFSDSGCNTPFLGEFYCVVRQNIELALRNIVAEHYTDWELKR